MSDFIAYLMQKGSYGHYWSKQTMLTTWWSTTTRPEIPALKEDLYFGVHPSTKQKAPRTRPTEEDIAAINCVYADVDSKDYGNSKKAATKHVKELNPPPSVIVDSGGGYHCYWLLEESFELNTTLKREIARSLQGRWVDYVGGDLAVHDLARILRLPGTLNYKYDPPREVRIVYENLTRLYPIEDLEKFLPETTDLEHRGDDGDPKIPFPQRPNTLTYQQLVTLAQSSVGGEKFVKLWKGWSEEYISESEADLAFCCILAFWTGGDYDKINELFRLSKRYREKWDREDYRYATIIKALQQVTEHYVDPGGYLEAGANDEGNAQCVFTRNLESVAFCGALGWLHYEGTHWGSEMAEASADKKIITTLKERRRAAITSDTIDEKYQEAIIRCAKPSAANIRNCKTVLKSLVTVPVAGFDASPDELNCHNGVLDLRTGKMSPHSSKKKFTYCLPISYDENANSSFWQQWLLDTVGGRQEVLDFLQLALGYSLTGHTREEVMFYVEGPARAGKGTFTETIISMLGGVPLATEVGMEQFVESNKSSGQGFLLAYMRACRFIAASESKESHWLDAANLKRWTGGNLVTCAQKYGHHFTYQPRYKIWLSSNWPLQMDADDIAGWSRVNIIKFPNSHLGAEDKLLKAHMKSPEILKGVLAWVAEGAMKWYELKGGLCAPKTIQEETQSARQNLDWVSKWVEEQILITGDCEGDLLPNAVYYQEYHDWCNEQGVSPKKLIALNRTLGRAGYEVGGDTFRYNGRTARGWRGAKLLTPSLREQLDRMKMEE